MTKQLQMRRKRASETKATTATQPQAATASSGRFSVVTVSLEKARTPEATARIAELSQQKEPDSKAGAIARFRIVGQRFISDMLALSRYVESISQFAAESSQRSDSEFADVLTGLLNSPERSKSKALARAKIVLRPDNDPEKLSVQFRDISTISEMKKILAVAEQQSRMNLLLCETAVQHIANVFEGLIVDLYSNHYYANPKSISKDQAISCFDVINADSIEELRDRIIADEAQRFIREPTEKQISLIDDFTKGNLKKNFPEVQELVEVLLRRHAIVHGRGRATAEYVRRVAAQGIKVTCPPGQSLGTDKNYVKSAFNIVFAAGVIISEMCCQRSTGEASGGESGSYLLNNSGLSALMHGHSRAGYIIFKYACQVEKDGGVADPVARINFAQACRWQGDDKTASELASKQKWRSANPVFQLCAASVRGDVEEFKRLLPIAAQEDEYINALDMYKWPIFEWMKKMPQYDEWVSAAFGETPAIVTGVQVRSPDPLPESVEVKSRKGRDRRSTITVE